MYRIKQDPNLETCPDYGAPEFNIICTALINAGEMNNKQVIQRLTDTWNQQKNRHIEAWNQQLIDDLRAQEELKHQQRQEEDERRAQREVEEEAERHEKKKPKMNGFDVNITVDDFITPWPATYALNKLESFKYIELWYFTQEGCLDALENHCFQTEDTLALKQLSAVKASRNAIKDADLTWQQMTMGRICFLQHASAANWP